MTDALIVKNTVIRTPIKQIVQDIQTILTNGKLRDVRQKGNELIVTCPFHKDGKESNPSCYVYCGDEKDGLRKGAYHCFTCGSKGSFQAFVAGCFDRSVSWAEDWLIKKYGEGTLSSNPALEIGFKKISLPSERVRGVVNTHSDQASGKYLAMLESYQSWHPYMSKRKLSRKVCEAFSVKYDPKTQSIVFPVWDDRGNLVMMTRRSVMTKAFNIDANKQKPVYLLNYIKSRKMFDAVCVCESQINCLYMWSLGHPAIAMFGTGASHQYSLLRRSGIKRYTLCFDGDQAGEQGALRFIANMGDDVMIDVMLLPSGKDVNDLSKEEIDSLRKIGKNEFVRLTKR